MKKFLPNSSPPPSLIIAMSDLLSAEMIAERDSICNFQTKAIIDDGNDVISKLQKLMPDFLFVDSELPNFNGFEFAKKIKSLNLTTRIVIYASKSIPIYLNEFLDGSNQIIRGFIHKGCGIDELDKCFREVFSGKKYMSTNINVYLNKMEQEISKHIVSHEKLLSLAHREKDVWDLMTQGKTEREIGEALFIGIATVKTYKKRIKDKLDFVGKGKLTYLALTNYR
jgi:DNA-binding NarL/FixJ family response regulator